MLSTWEAASDNDLTGYSGPVILDCYDSQTHNNSLTLTGATNVSATIYREVRSAAGCAAPFDGELGTGANFSDIFNVNELYGRLNEICVEVTLNNTGTGITQNSIVLLTNSYAKAIKCVARALNTGTGTANGFYTSNGHFPGRLFYDCIAIGCKTDGFLVNPLWADDGSYFVNCVAGGNGGIGFRLGANAGVNVAWNCYGANNTGGDFSEAGWDAPSGWNASKDNTSDLGGAAGDNYKNALDLITLGKLDADYLALANDLYAAGGAGANYGRNPLDDFTATYDFRAEIADWAKDIRGTDRPSAVADASWNVGASQKAPTVSGNALWFGG